MKRVRITTDAELDEDDFDDLDHVRRTVDHQLALRGIDVVHTDVEGVE